MSGAPGGIRFELVRYADCPACQRAGSSPQCYSGGMRCRTVVPFRRHPAGGRRWAASGCSATLCRAPALHLRLFHASCATVELSLSPAAIQQAHQHAQWADADQDGDELAQEVEEARDHQVRDGIGWAAVGCMSSVAFL